MLVGLVLLLVILAIHVGISVLVLLLLLVHLRGRCVLVEIILVWQLLMAIEGVAHRGLSASDVVVVFLDNIQTFDVQDASRSVEREISHLYDRVFLDPLLI